MARAWMRAMSAPLASPHGPQDARGHCSSDESAGSAGPLQYGDGLLRDDELTDDERRYLAEFLTPVHGSGGLLYWPVGELGGGDAC